MPGSNELPLPPRVPGLPWLGGVFHLMKGEHGCPYDAVVKIHEEHGPVFRTEVLNRTWWMSSVYEHAREILLERRDVFIKGTTFEAVRGIGLGGQGIFTTDGEEWKRQRAIVQPAFRKASIKLVFEEMNRVALQSLPLLAEGGELRVCRLTDRISLATVCSVTMGIDPGLLESLGSSSPLLKRMNFATKQVMHRVQRGPFWKHMPIPANWKLKRVIAEQIEFLRDILKADLDPSSEDKDLLSLLREAYQEGDQNELMDHMQNFLTAGHETTAATLSWLLYYLSENPELQEEISKEAQDALAGTGQIGKDELDAMPILNSAVLETLRLRPAAPYLMREAAEDSQVGEYKVEKGSFVWVLTGLLHTNPAHWGEDAHAFVPARFRRGKPPDAFMPFGMGPRKCIGERMALFELSIVAAHLVNSYRFLPVSGQVIAPFVTIAWGFKGGLRLRTEKR